MRVALIDAIDADPADLLPVGQCTVTRAPASEVREFCEAAPMGMLPWMAAVGGITHHFSMIDCIPIRRYPILKHHRYQGGKGDATHK